MVLIPEGISPGQEFEVTLSDRGHHQSSEEDEGEEEDEEDEAAASSKVAAVEEEEEQQQEQEPQPQPQAAGEEQSEEEAVATGKEEQEVEQNEDAGAGSAGSAGSNSGGEVLQLVCPADAKPGDVLTVQTGDGGEIEVAIPDGIGPGQEFEVQISHEEELEEELGAMDAAAAREEEEAGEEAAEEEGGRAVEGERTAGGAWDKWHGPAGSAKAKTNSLVLIAAGGTAKSSDLFCGHFPLD